MRGRTPKNLLKITARMGTSVLEGKEKSAQI